MIPMMRSMMSFLTTSENMNTIAITATAPKNAPVKTAAKPLNDKAPVVRLPPKSRMTSAAPTPAPLLMPNIDGSARGLRKAVCNIKPLTASDIPDNKAVTA